MSKRTTGLWGRVTQAVRIEVQIPWGRIMSEDSENTGKTEIELKDHREEEASAGGREPNGEGSGAMEGMGEPNLTCLPPPP